MVYQRDIVLWFSKKAQDTKDNSSNPLKAGIGLISLHN